MNLRPAGIKLLNEVETKIRKGVCIIEMKGWALRQGDSTISDDGTPLIRISERLFDAEGTIVHELSHLKLRADGFADTTHRFLSMNVDESGPIHETMQRYRETIQHYIFFPTIRRMGIDPFATTREEWMAFNYSSKPSGPANRPHLTFVYFTAKLLLDDPDLMNTLTVWFQRNGFAGELRAGEGLATIVKNLDPKTPQVEIRAYIEVLNGLPGIAYKFQAGNWTEQKLGSFTGPLVEIRITPK